MVGAAGLVSGLAILGVAMRAGWLLGSLGAGAIIARYGSGHAYLFVAAAYLAGGLAMLPGPRGGAGGPVRIRFDMAGRSRASSTR